ncbi:MAG: hypothetical protein ACYDHY_06615 [Acidiferrobacterales bacterium]
MRRFVFLAVLLLTCAVPRPKPEPVLTPDPEGGVSEPDLDAGCCPYKNHFDCVDTEGKYSISCPPMVP